MCVYFMYAMTSPAIDVLIRHSMMNLTTVDMNSISHGYSMRNGSRFRQRQCRRSVWRR